MKIAFTLVVMMLSTNVFAMGRTDNSLIQASLDSLQQQGYSCKTTWPENFFLSQVEAGSQFNIAYLCTDAAGNKVEKTIVYEADGNQYARCRDIRALSLDDGTSL